MSCGHPFLHSRFALILEASPMTWIVISGVIATIATTPKASVTMFPPRAEQAPCAIGSRNAAVIGPDATPPESKAIAV